MSKDVPRALLFLVIWSACSGLVWRLAFRALAMSIEDPSLRSGAGTFTFATSLLLSYPAVNLMHHQLGGVGSFLRWSVRLGVRLSVPWAIVIAPRATH